MVTTTEAAARNPLSCERCSSAPPLLGTTIGANLAKTAISFGHNEALVDCAAGRRWTYAELLSDVRRLATGLLNAGIAAGDRVGIWAANRWEWVLVQYATAQIGAILVTINPAYRARELRYARAHAARCARRVLYPRLFGDGRLLERAGEDR